MNRNAISELLKWKQSEERKPMVLKGTRQVGKTWIMKNFGKNYYENFVLQQLKGAFEVEPHYFSDKHGEIDFILQNKTQIVPIEVKGGEDKSAASFKKYIAAHSPEHAFRFSKRGYRKDREFTNVPLYLVCKTKEFLI